MPENPNKQPIEYGKEKSLLREEEERKLVCKALMNSLHNLKNYTTPNITNNSTEKPNQGSLNQLMGMAIHSATGDLLYQYDIDYKQIEKHIKNFFNNPASIELIAIINQKREAIENIMTKGKKGIHNEQTTPGIVEKETLSRADIKKIKELMTTFRDSFSPQANSGKERDYNTQPGFSAFIDAIVSMQHHGKEVAIHNDSIGKEVALKISRTARNQLYEFCKNAYPKESASPLENLLLEKKINFTLKNTTGTKTAVNESILDFLYRDYIAVKAEDGNKDIGSFAEFRRYVADSLMPKASAGRNLIYEDEKNQKMKKTLRESGALTICDIRQYSILPHNNRQIVLPTYAVLLILSDPKVPEQKLTNLQAAYEKLTKQTKEKEQKPQYLSFKTKTTAYSNLERRNRHAIKNTQGGKLTSIFSHQQSSSKNLSNSFLNKIETKKTESTNASLLKSNTNLKNTSQVKNITKMFEKNGEKRETTFLNKQLSTNIPVAAKTNQYPMFEASQNKKTETKPKFQNKYIAPPSAARKDKTADLLQNDSARVKNGLGGIPALPIKQESPAAKQNITWTNRSQNSNDAQKKEGGQAR